MNWFPVPFKSWKRALELLEEARGAIMDELVASGDQDLDHPVLRKHSATAEKIRLFLEQPYK